jgi:hypothetical protein
MQRVLEYRDRIQIALNKPQDNDTGDEALAAFEIELLLLMGAVDAMAAAVHALLGINYGGYPGWQHKRWLAQITNAAPSLGGLFREGTDHQLVLTLLRLLRNSVHGEALAPLAVNRGRRRDRTLVGMPRAHLAELATIFAALGGAAQWGVEEVIRGHVHADAGVLSEQLLPRIVHMLNAVMDEAPVETLPHVSLKPEDLRPPEGARSQAFGDRERLSIRLQLGL